MINIGFVDYYLNEWHANNYPQWIKEANNKLGLHYKISFAWAERQTSFVDEVTSEEWCHERKITLCDSLEELCEKSDVIIVLAPSNPEKHLEYASIVLKYKKPTYIDKTFAPNLLIAKEIYKIAEQNGTPFFSTSALRYAEELEKYNNTKNLIITGGGSDFAEYIIHQVEMAVLILKSPMCSVSVECRGNQKICKILTENGKSAILIYANPLPFTILAETVTGNSLYDCINSNFFCVLIEKILLFFQSSVLPFSSAETLEVMRIREALIEADKEKLL